MNSLRKTLVVTVVVALAGVLAVPAAADLRAYFCWLEGSQVVPPNDQPNVGGGCFFLDTETRILSYDIFFWEYPGQETAAHFHGPAEPGENAPVVFSLPLGNPKSGSVGPLTPDQMWEFLSAYWYVDIHTAAYPDGQLRGQVKGIYSGGAPNPCTLPVDGSTWGRIKALYR